MGLHLENDSCVGFAICFIGQYLPQDVQVISKPLRVILLESKAVTQAAIMIMRRNEIPALCGIMGDCELTALNECN